MKTIRYVLPLIVAAACLTVGCRSSRLYHEKQSVYPSSRTNFYSAFIEFDEHGELWLPQQLDWAIAHITNSQPVFLVTYVHGWKHNAASNDINYQSFTNMLDAIADQLAIDNPGVKTVGVYIGWRGDSLLGDNPVSKGVRQLTFWSRRNAAERVAGTSATEAIYSVLRAANSHKESRVVLIGHSMGGLILERALSQAMVPSLMEQQQTSGRRAPADLVLLVNSAAPSLYARQFISMLGRLDRANGTATTSNTRKFTWEQPLIISATSEGDWATGKVFPIGMKLASLTKSFRAYGTNDPFGGKQLHYYTKTAGHNNVLWSHQITRLSAKSRKQASNYEIQQTVLRENMAFGRERRTFVVDDKEYRIDPVPNARNRTPYWVMQVPTEIIKDHGDIFSHRFTGLVGAFLRMTEVTTKEYRRPEIDARQFKAN